MMLSERIVAAKKRKRRNKESVYLCFLCLSGRR